MGGLRRLSGNDDRLGYTGKAMARSRDSEVMGLMVGSQPIGAVGEQGPRRHGRLFGGILPRSSFVQHRHTEAFRGFRNAEMGEKGRSQRPTTFATGCYWAK